MWHCSFGKRNGVLLFSVSTNRHNLNWSCRAKVATGTITRNSYEQSSLAVPVVLVIVYPCPVRTPQLIIQRISTYITLPILMDRLPLILQCVIRNFSIRLPCSSLIAPLRCVLVSQSKMMVARPRSGMSWKTLHAVW